MFQFLVGLTIPQKQRMFLALDVALVPIAVFLTFALQPTFADPAAALREHWALLPLLMLAAAGLAQWLGIPRIRLNAYEMPAVMKSVALSTALALLFGSLTALSGAPMPPAVSISFGIDFFLLTVASRLVMLHVVTALYRASQPVTRVLIYGAGRTGMQLASALKAHPSIRAIAFIDDNAALQGALVSGLPVHGAPAIPTLCQAHKIRRVLLAMPSTTQPKRTQIARRLEKLGLEVQSLPSFAQLIGEEALIDKLVPTPVHKFLGREARCRHLADGGGDYAGKTILISGAGGSIGSELCRQVLSCKPKKVVLLELSELALYTVDMEARTLAEVSRTEVVPVLGSVCDDALVRRVLSDEGVEIVLHAAAYKHVPLVEMNAVAGLANNVFGTLTLAQAARDHGVRRFVQVSTDKAVRPANVMGASKRLAELLVQDLAGRADDTIFSIVRFGNVLGSSGSVIPLFEEQIARGGPVTLTHPEVTRYFMTVQEAAQLVLLAGSIAEGGEVFVLDMGEAVPVRRLAVQMIEAAGYSVRDAHNPAGDVEIVTTGLRPGEKLHEELMINAGDQVTVSQKIFRVREDKLSEIEIAAALRDLREAVAMNDEAAVRAVVSRWVLDERRAAIDESNAGVWSGA